MIHRSTILFKIVFFLFFYLISFNSQSQKSFTSDTIRIEKALRKKMDGNTLEAKEGLANAITEYDKLLNTYYKSCLALLKPEDKSVFIEAQRAWLTWFTKEQKFMELKYDPKYTGGGNIWSSIIISDILDIYKNRVFDIYNHWQVLSGEL